jgi:hypothetical protein
MKWEATRFTNKKPTPENARGSKDFRWKKRQCVPRIRNTPLKIQGVQKTFHEKRGIPFHE